MTLLRYKIETIPRLACPPVGCLDSVSLRQWSHPFELLHSFADLQETLSKRSHMMGRDSPFMLTRRLKDRKQCRGHVLHGRQADGRGGAGEVTHTLPQNGGQFGAARLLARRIQSL